MSHEKMNLEQAEQLLNDTMSKAAVLNKEQQYLFFLEINLASLAVMRGLKGIEFVADYLHAAVNDAKPMVIVPSKKVKH